jgi:ribonuclease PH
MDGEISKDALLRAIQMAQKVTEKIHEVQKKALKDKYARED